MSADRRTLAIAAAAMVLLIGVGVVSAALFTRSACADVGPEPVDARAAGTDLPDIVGQAFADLDADERGAVVGGVSTLAEVLGPVSGIADVGDADRLAVLGAGVAAFGADASVLGPGGAQMRAAAAFEDPAVVVGSGNVVFSVALANELTGQVDAVQPLDRDLEEVGSCLDTATVNVPFAFHLDAADGDLLLFRVDEDADDPELELRDQRGSVWTASLEIALAPPGLLGERLDGRLGDDLAVVARRIVPDDTAVAITAVDRRDGTPRWTLGPEDLPRIGTDPVWIEVLAVSEEVVIVGLAEETARDRQVLLGVSPEDGAIRWADTDAEPVLQVLVADGRATEVLRERDRVVLRDLDPETGQRGDEARGEVAGDGGRAAVLPDGRILTTLGEDGVLLRAPGQLLSVTLEAAVDDVVVDAEGRTTLLLSRGADGVAVTFG